MKIILASDQSFLFNYGYNLTGILKDEMKIGYVTTAAKGTSDSKFFEKLKNTIEDKQYPIEAIDIEGKTIEYLRTFFKDKNIIHVEGGNTFYLLKVIRETGFDKILDEFLVGGNVYIGTSAGAYIMCPTIEVASWNEDNESRYGVTDFQALNYVPFFVKAHYADDKKTDVSEMSKGLSKPLKILREGQGILVEDGKYTFVGGEETKLN